MIYFDFIVTDAKNAVLNGSLCIIGHNLRSITNSNTQHAAHHNWSIPTIITQ